MATTERNRFQSGTIPVFETAVELTGLIPVYPPESARTHLLSDARPSNEIDKATDAGGMGVVPGWADGDVFVLLELFRAHLWDYIYRSSEAFAEIVHAALPGAFPGRRGAPEWRKGQRGRRMAPFAALALILAGIMELYEWRWILTDFV